MRTGNRTGNGRAAARFSGPAAGFSVLSFAIGLAVGAVVAVIVVYLLGPGAGEASPEAQYEPPTAEAPDFEFWERLPNAWVAPDTAPYETGGGVRTEPARPMEYLLQAGAFHRAGAAERRRAELILAGMPATTSTVGVDDGVLYRVVVGPFETRAETQTAMRQLRERDIVAVLLERPAPAG
ncbi:MAG: SPOR domain-containing protein [Gammaproteobacteria bacterium]|nr:SPOR domain-containing protein [Gammaproteobacteria bacterium]